MTGLLVGSSRAGRASSYASALLRQQQTRVSRGGGAGAASRRIGPAQGREDTSSRALAGARMRENGGAAPADVAPVW
jgi:hypothetical protein